MTDSISLRSATEHDRRHIDGQVRSKHPGCLRAVQQWLRASDRTRAHARALELGRWTSPAPLGTSMRRSGRLNPSNVGELRKAEANDRTTEQQRRVSAIQQKLDKLDEVFLYSEAIDVTTYGRQRDKLREELTFAKIDHHTDAVDELDVERILAFAERILPRASDLWVQASLDYKQRLQQLFFPKGIADHGNRFNRTAVTAPLFNKSWRRLSVLMKDW